MKKNIIIFLAATLILPAFAAEKSFQSIFDGKTLKGWNGNPKFWSVKDGAITGQTTKGNPTKGNTFIIWEGGKLKNFVLVLDFKIVGGNSGIQYRSFKKSGNHDGWRIGGYQADLPREPGETAIQESVTGKHSVASYPLEVTKQPLPKRGES